MAADRGSNVHQRSGPRDDRASLNPWALLAILASTLVLCPLATLAGPLMGIKALGQIRTDPAQRGSGLAKAAIIVGSLTTAMWLGAAYWWHINVRRPILSGPSAALQAGFDGDLDGFRAGFCCEAADASREQAIVFLAELSRRYGRFQGMRQDQSADAASVQAPSGPGVRKRVPYVLEFDSGRIRATADFVLTDPGEHGFAGRFSRLEILDDNLGDITYPPILSGGDVDEAAPAASPTVDGRDPA